MQYKLLLVTCNKKQFSYWIFFTSLMLLWNLSIKWWLQDQAGRRQTHSLSRAENVVNFSSPQESISFIRFEYHNYTALLLNLNASVSACLSLCVCLRRQWEWVWRRTAGRLAPAEESSGGVLQAHSAQCARDEHGCWGFQAVCEGMPLHSSRRLPVSLSRICSENILYAICSFFLMFYR